MFKKEKEDPEDMEKRGLWVSLIHLYHRLNLIALAIAIILNGLFTAVMLINFNAGVVMFMLNLYNLFILLIYYMRRKHD